MCGKEENKKRVGECKKRHDEWGWDERKKKRGEKREKKGSRERDGIRDSFFFQAEGGMRDRSVWLEFSGALPISGIDKSKDNWIDLFWISKTFKKFFDLMIFERAGNETVPTAIPANAKLIW